MRVMRGGLPPEGHQHEVGPDAVAGQPVQRDDRVDVVDMPLLSITRMDSTCACGAACRISPAMNVPCPQCVPGG